MTVELAVSAAMDAADRAHAALVPALLAAHVTGTTIDPLLFALIAGQILAAAPPPELPALRAAPLAAWVPRVNAVVQAMATAATTSTAVAPIAVMRPTIVGPHIDLEPPELPPPGAPPPPALPPGPPIGGLPIPAPPPGLDEATREAWIQARTRAGEYARGLGNYVAEDIGQLVAEEWDGEHIATEASAEQRAAGARIIREETADAVAGGLSSEKLASNLANRTGDYARNWRRIARTELQGVANDGAAIEALRTYGAEARVARIPNADACPDCRRLFLGDDGKPRIFTVAELVGNGVNVGRARRDWVASLWPVHPNCNCTTQSIPPGMRFADDWGLELAA